MRVKKKKERREKREKKKRERGEKRGKREKKDKSNILKWFRGSLVIKIYNSIIEVGQINIKPFISFQNLFSSKYPINIVLIVSAKCLKNDLISALIKYFAIYNIIALDIYNKH